VGSTLNFYARILSDFYLTGAYGILLKAFKKYGLNGFTLVLIPIPDATRDLVLELEQHVLDTLPSEYYTQPFANSSAGRILSEEHRAKISASRKGQNHSEETRAKLSASHIGEKDGNFNKGIPIYLYKVHSSEFELCATFPARMYRAAETLGIARSTLYYYMQNRTLFKINGLNHILSRKKNEE